MAVKRIQLNKFKAIIKDFQLRKPVYGPDFEMIDEVRKPSIRHVKKV